MSRNEFKAGEVVYTSAGTKCRFVEQIDNVGVIGSYLVIPFLEHEDEAGFGNPFFALEIFSKPPKEEKNAEIVALDIEIVAKKIEVGRLNGEIDSVKSERAGMLARIREHDALKRIDDYLAGKFNFFVVLYENLPCIVAAQNALKEDVNAWGHRLKKGVKLLTLFGVDNNGESRGLQWRVNQYADGSGYDTEVIPVVSEDEGREMIQRIYDVAVEDWRQRGGNLYPHRALWWAKSEYVTPPEDVKSFIKQYRIKAAFCAVEEAKQKLENAIFDLKKIEREE